MPKDTGVEIHFQLHPSPRTSRPGQAPTVVEMPSRGRLPRLTQVLALAIHFDYLIRRDEANSYAELARLGGVTRERMSQIMKLIWLAPDIQQEILYLPPTPGGRYPLSEFAVRKIANELCWIKQREQWRQLQARYRLG
jgi:hypothetical protein